MRTETTDVLVVGAGPAGLAAARELRRLGDWQVTVLEREQEPGGVPRHCHHPGFGLRDLHRSYSGPGYAARWTALATGAGAQVRSRHTVTEWAGDTALVTTSPAGRTRWNARAVLLATGCRERPRPARLVPGARPAGVLTTGALQQFAYLRHQQVARRAVVIGAEHVSFSAVHTLASHGASVAAVVSDLPGHQTYAPLVLATSGLRRVPLLTGTEVTAIRGRNRVEAVMVTDRATGASRVVECDTVVFTGDWVPDYELVRSGGLTLDPATKGAVVDTGLRTQRPGVFAAGNLLHPAETADVCALDGVHVAAAIDRWLRAAWWPQQAELLAVRAAAPLAWVVPQLLAPGEPPPRGRFLLRSSAMAGRARLEARQDGRLLHRSPPRTLVPNRSITLGTQRHWLPWVGGPVEVGAAS